MDYGYAKNIERILHQRLTPCKLKKAHGCGWCRWWRCDDAVMTLSFICCDYHLINEAGTLRGAVTRSILVTSHWWHRPWSNLQQTKGIPRFKIVNDAAPYLFTATSNWELQGQGMGAISHQISTYYQLVSEDSIVLVCITNII